MGDYAEMMLEGDVCSMCGDYMDDSLGFPGMCSSCSDELPKVKKIRKKKAVKVACDICGRRVKEAGLNDHKRDAHSGRSLGEYTFEKGDDYIHLYHSEAGISVMKSGVPHGNRIEIKIYGSSTHTGSENDETLLAEAKALRDIVLAKLTAGEQA